jgi:hypothetical protein
MSESQATLRQLRGLRFSPPGYAVQGGRASAFRAALEQCEQFLLAAREAGYATRPVHLFYALSQASRAIVAASPLISNQSWQVRGHGLSSTSNASLTAPAVSQSTVTAERSGLFISLATAIGAEPLPPGTPVSLDRLWPLLPETVDTPLTSDAEFPALLFMPTNWPSAFPFALAELNWIPRHVKERCSNDRVQVIAYLQHYPSMKGAQPPSNPIYPEVTWTERGYGFSLTVEWRDDSELHLNESKTVSELRASTYRAADDIFVTPAIGSMVEGLHPLLALWSLLLGLSSLARYEPAVWARICDIDRSPEANAVEHLLDVALASVPAAVLHQLETFAGLRV